jgi:hypothetical protein
MGMVRFIAVVLVTVGLITLIGRSFSEYEDLALKDPFHMMRGIGAWITALLIAVLVEVLVRRRREAHWRNRDSQDLPSNPADGVNRSIPHKDKPTQSEHKEKRHW